jgi:hypothetical protein
VKHLLAFLAVLILASCVGEYRCYDRCLDLSKEYEAKGYQTDIAFGRVRGRPHCVMMYSEDGIQWHRWIWHDYDRTMTAEFYLNYIYCDENDYQLLKERSERMGR